MTEKAYKADEWLNKTVILYDDAEAIHRRIEVIEGKVNSAVSCYEHGARLDPIQAQARRENLLLEYSQRQSEFETKYFKYVRQEIITMFLLNKMQNRKFALILYKRYINRETVEAIAKQKLFGYGRTQLYKFYGQALEEFASILQTEEPRAIQEAEKSIEKHRAKLYQRQVTA